MNKQKAHISPKTEDKSPEPSKDVGYKTWPADVYNLWSWIAYVQLTHIECPLTRRRAKGGCTHYEGTMDQGPRKGEQ